ncbi:MAG: hypothetical protein WC627_02715 [Legionella sp.]|jgi:hypothetical protein
MNFKFEYVGGFREHTNHIAKLTALNKGLTVGIGRLLNKHTDEEFAQMSQAMGIVLRPNGSLKQVATYTETGVPLVDGYPERCDYFIGSNKHNACPLIFIRNKNEKTTTLFMWHLAYEDLMMQPYKEVQKYLPRYFNEIENNSNYQKFHIKSILSDPKSEILVTHQALLSGARLNCGAQAQLFALPEDLRIVSSGLEGSIRSYSIAYFPKNDLLLLSGEAGDDQSHFWVMQDPFSRKNSWVRLKTCDALIKQVKRDDSKKDLSQLLIDELNLNKVLSADNTDAERVSSYSI